MDEILVMKAKWAALVERAAADNDNKMAAVAYALLDVMDYAVETKVISHRDQVLPNELDHILNNVYSYLGQTQES